MKKLIALLTFSAAIFSTSFARAEDEIVFEKDVVYGKAGQDELKLDIARPKTGNGPFPAIVFIHGGGWRMGKKESFDGAIQTAAKHGYVAVSVEYRFAPKHKFPAQVEDCKCAVRYLRSRATELKLNDKIGAIGDSAGGHLSLLLGLMNKDDELEGLSGYPEFSSKVQAVVNMYGPSDLTDPKDWNPAAIMMATDFLGTTDTTSPILKKASPICYIDKNDPPVLSFHGSADGLVPPSQSTRLHEALKKAGVTEKLEIIEGAGHGWGGEARNKTMKEAQEFFDANLKK